MRKRLISIVMIVAAPLIMGASYAIPSFTLSGPPSTGATCTPTAAASGLASAAPAGTVMFNCVVAPSNWVGAASSNEAALVVTALSGNTFNLALASAGVAQTYPASTGSLTP
jgi:hypothetical protein